MLRPFFFEAGTQGLHAAPEWAGEGEREGEGEGERARVFFLQDRGPGGDGGGWLISGRGEGGGEASLFFRAFVLRCARSRGTGVGVSEANTLVKMFFKAPNFIDSADACVFCSFGAA